MEVRELPYTDEIIEIQRESNDAQLLEFGERALKLYLLALPTDDYQPDLKNYYLIAKYFYHAIANNDFSVFYILGAAQLK